MCLIAVLIFYLFVPGEVILPAAEIFFNNSTKKLLNTRCENTTLFSVKWVDLGMLTTFDREMILT